jgi:hypothetical protein
MRRRALAALLVLTLLTGTGCAALSRAAGRDQARPLVVVLFDVSRSTHDAEVRARYLDAFARVLDDVEAEHGTVVADVIDDNPLAHSTFPIRATFEACDPLTDNRLACEARTAQLRRDALDASRSILARTSEASGTDIYDGVALAQRVFDAYPEAGARRLVICSDMVENASVQPSPARLGGVTVYVVGAGVVAGDELAPDRILELQRRWLAYFAQTGADLTPARYGATLVRFP